MRHFFLSLILGYLGFCYEIFLARLATIFVGGSFFQLTTLIGFFTFFMGFSSLFFDFFLKRWTEIFKHALRLQTVLLIAIYGLIVNQSKLLDVQLFWYMAACVFGFITGIEIPALIYKYQNLTKKIIASDYLGLFLASVVFPLFFLNSFSVKQILLQFIVVSVILNTYVYFLPRLEKN
jgi:predicted membrane-bound spermidine synthase